jgi:hypothetical protein
MHPSILYRSGLSCCNRASSSVVSDPSLSLGVYWSRTGPGHCNRSIRRPVVTDQRLARAHARRQRRAPPIAWIRSDLRPHPHVRATRGARCTVTLSPQLPSIPRCPNFFNVGAEEPLTQATMHSIIHMGSSPEWGQIHRLSVARRRHTAHETFKAPRIGACC